MSDPGQPPEGGWPSIHPDADTGPTPDPSGGAPNPWDPPAGAPEVPVPPPPVPGHVPSAGPAPAAGTGSAKRIKPASVSGRRPPSIAIIGGLGLLGLLITIAIMAVLSSRVLSSTSGTEDTSGETVPPELTTPTTVGDAPATGDAPAAVDAARAATCRADKATLETAIEAFTVTTGLSPSDQEELVAAGLLSESLPDFTLTAGAAGTQVTGTGTCAGT